MLFCLLVSFVFLFVCLFLKKELPCKELSLRVYPPVELIRICGALFLRSFVQRSGIQPHSGTYTSGKRKQKLIGTSTTAWPQMGWRASNTRTHFYGCAFLRLAPNKSSKVEASFQGLQVLGCHGFLCPTGKWVLDSEAPDGFDSRGQGFADSCLTACTCKRAVYRRRIKQTEKKKFGTILMHVPHRKQAVWLQDLFGRTSCSAPRHHLNLCAGIEVDHRVPETASVMDVNDLKAKTPRVALSTGGIEAAVQPILVRGSESFLHALSCLPE